MKKTLSVLVLLSSLSSLVYATNLPDAGPGTAVIRRGTTYSVYYSGSQEADVTIAIRDADNNIVFKEVLKNVDGFVRPYNFSHLAEGSYAIEIKDDQGLRTEWIRYEKASDANLARLIKVSDSERRFLLMLSNKVPANVTVKIFDEAGNIIYSHAEKITGDFAKVYNLGKYDGTGRFEITDSGGVIRTLSY